MARREDWPEKLAAFVDARRHLPFAWGANDCASFAFLAAAEITGRTVREIDWHDIHDAAQRLEAFGGIEALATAALGAPAENILAMRRGDIALVPQENKDRLGLMVCLGNELAGPGVDRLRGRPSSAALKFWRVD